MSEIPSVYQTEPVALDHATAAPSTQADEADGAEARRRELSAFLRSRRARLAPDDVGLTPGRRRRTPGLRREEVADLAGVGVTWYTWLEQGRDIRPSVEVLQAISRALRLSADERDHLCALAGTKRVLSVAGTPVVSKAVQAILDGLEPYPAFVVNSRYDVLAWNRAETALIGDFAELDEQDRNVLWLIFTSPTWRRLLFDYDDDVRRIVAKFRAAMGRHLGERAWAELVERLTAASPEFRDVWERHEVAGAVSVVKRLLHPTTGLLRLDHTTLRISDMPECELRVYTPADEATGEALHQLLATNRNQTSREPTPAP